MKSLKVLASIVLALLLALPNADTIAASDASGKARDAKHHRNQAQAKETHTFKGDRTVRRYSTSKKELEDFQRNPKGKHVTTQAKGRLPSPESAKAKYGLEKEPKYVFTGKAKDMKVQGKGHDKPVGGKHNATEARVAQQKVDWQSGKIIKMDGGKR